jgi:hypothetical protein
VLLQDRFCKTAGDVVCSDGESVVSRSTLELRFKVHMNDAFKVNIILIDLAAQTSF